jgi:hypothetical protein
VAPTSAAVTSASSPLDDPPRLPRRHAAIDHEEAAETVRPDPEIGQCRRHPAGDRGTDRRGILEQPRRHRLVREGIVGGAHQADMRGDDQLPRQRRDPVRRHATDRRLVERVVGADAGGHEHATVELGVLLPFEPEQAEIGGPMVRTRLRRRDAEPGREVGDRPPRRVLGDPLGQQRQVGEAHGGAQMLRRPRMHLVVQLDALRMVGRQAYLGAEQGERLVHERASDAAVRLA